MKFIILFGIIAVAFAARPTPPPSPPPPPSPTPQQQIKQYKSSDAEISILSSYNDQEILGDYKFGFETDAGQSRAESGKLMNAGTDEQAYDVTGSYSYTDANGDKVEVSYRSGPGGFVPFGTNIPDVISKLAKSLSELKSSTFSKTSKY